MQRVMFDVVDVQRDEEKQLLSLDVHPTLVCIVHFYSCRSDCASRSEIGYLCVTRYIWMWL